MASQNATASKPGNRVTVATTDTPIVTADDGRGEITITNDGANVVYLRLAATGASINAVAIRLNAAGGNFTTDFKGAISGFAVTGATDVLVGAL
jgi:hypothetical protein